MRTDSGEQKECEINIKHERNRRELGEEQKREHGERLEII